MIDEEFDDSNEVHPLIFIGASLSKDHETAVNQEIKCDTTRFTHMRTSGGRRYLNSFWEQQLSKLPHKSK